jgi:hypothetical protein
MNIAKIQCGFCTSGAHQFCRSVVVNGDGVTLVKCPCECEQSQSLRCTLCENRTQTDINPESYVCLDVNACVGEFNRKRSILRETLYPQGTAVKDKPKGAECNCQCGDSTSGGLFKPGHADKLVASLAKEIKAGAMAEDDAREMLLHLSEGLLKKLDARL